MVPQERIRLVRVAADAHQIMTQELHGMLELIPRGLRDLLVRKQGRVEHREIMQVIGGELACGLLGIRLGPCSGTTRIAGSRMLRHEIAHGLQSLVQRIIGEHARIIPLREGKPAREQLHHLHGIQSEIVVAGHLRDHTQRLLARHRIGVARDGVHIHAHRLNKILQIIEALIVAIGDIADETRGHFNGLGEIADGIEPTRADHRVADHRVHTGQRLRIKTERRHVHAGNLHAAFGAFGGRHHGGEAIEIPLHGHADDRVRVGKTGHRHVVALFGILLARLADHMVP